MEPSADGSIQGGATPGQLPMIQPLELAKKTLGELYKLPDKEIKHAEALTRSLCRLSPWNPLFRETIIDLMNIGVSSQSIRHSATDFIVDALVLQGAPNLQLDAAKDITKFEAVRKLIWTVLPLIDGPEKADLAQETLRDIISYAK